MTKDNLAQQILSQPNVFLAIQQKRIAKQQEIIQLQTEMHDVFNSAIAPLPRANNRVEFAMQIARNAFNLWQGISLGMKVVRGVKSAFKK